MKRESKWDVQPFFLYVYHISIFSCLKLPVSKCSSSVLSNIVVGWARFVRSNNVRLWKKRHKACGMWIWSENISKSPRKQKSPTKLDVVSFSKSQTSAELASESSAVWLLMPANYSPEDGPVLEVFLLLVQFFQKTHLSVPVYCQNWTAETPKRQIPTQCCLTIQETKSESQRFHIIEFKHYCTWCRKLQFFSIW